MSRTRLMISGSEYEGLVEVQLQELQERCHHDTKHNPVVKMTWVRLSSKLTKLSDCSAVISGMCRDSEEVAADIHDFVDRLHRSMGDV
jgi:hypothetical protein